MVYRGTSSNPSSSANTICSSSKRGSRLSLNDDKQNVLSMKKSAEIAAVFSGARISQTTNIVENEDDNNNTEEEEEEEEVAIDSADDAYDSKRANCSCSSSAANTKTRPGGRYSRSNMQSSLGYFP